MQFDCFYETVGAFGAYQKLKYFIICLTYILPPIMVYTWTFTAATPEFRCRTPLDDFSGNELTRELINRYVPSETQCREYKSQISIRECQRCYQSSNKSSFFSEKDGPLKACKSFIFDRTYYQSTLVEEWSMVCTGTSMKSFVQTVFFFGYMIGSLIFGILSDRFGRRPIMGVSFFIIAIASFICAFAPQEQLGFDISYALFVVGRFLLACGTRGVTLTGFVIGVEIVGPKQRLFTGIVIQYFFGIGELILLLFAYLFRTWRLLHVALAILSLPFLFFYFVLPESPRWLISKGRYAEAEQLFRKIAKRNRNTFDPIAYQRLVTLETRRTSLKTIKSHGIMDLFRSKVMCIIVMNMSFQWFVQNLVFYGVSQNTGAWLLNPYIAFAASAIVEIFAYFIAHLVLHRWGRKTTYCVFVVGFTIFAFLVVPVQMLMIKGSRGQKGLMFIINVILKFCASGSYAVIYIYANELFPTQIRNTGMGVCSMVARVGAIFGTLSNDLLARLWSHAPIVVFGVTSLIAVALVTICPETVNKSLPQTIDDIEIMGLSFPMGSSKPFRPVQVVTDEEIHEEVALQQQLKPNANGTLPTD